MKQFLIKTKDDYLTLLYNLPELLDIDSTKLESLFEFDYINEEGQTNFEYVDSLSEEAIENFEEKSVRLNSISIQPEQYPCVFVFYVNVTPLNTLRSEHTFIYLSDFV